MPSSFTSSGHPAWCTQHLADDGIDLHVSDPVRIEVPGGEPVEATLQQDADADPVLYVYNHATGSDETLGRGDALAKVQTIALQLLSVQALLMLPVAAGEAS